MSGFTGLKKKKSQLSKKESSWKLRVIIILLLRKEICGHVYTVMQFGVERKLQAFEEVVEWLGFKELAKNSPFASYQVQNKK